MKKIIFAMCIALFALQAAAYPRSQTQRAHFMKAHPCPATVAHSKLSCPGFVVDHIVALCDGGKDQPSNMQWQTVAAGRLKDKTECKSKHKAVKPVVQPLKEVK